MHYNSLNNTENYLFLDFMTKFVRIDNFPIFNSHLGLITGFVTKVTERVSIVEQKLHTLP